MVHEPLVGDLRRALNAARQQVPHIVVQADEFGGFAFVAPNAAAGPATPVGEA